jgi:hypothetical protein
LRTVIQQVAIWVFRHFALFIIIVGILSAATLIQKTITEWSSLNAEHTSLQADQRHLEEHLRTAKAGLSNRLALLKHASEKALDARIAAVDKEIGEKTIEQQKISGLPNLFRSGSVQSGIAARIKLDLEINLLQQERDHLIALSSTIREPRNLEQLRQKHIAAYNQLKQNETEQDMLRRSNPFLVHVPASVPNRKLSQLRELHKQLDQENRIAHENHKRREISAKTAATAAQSFNIREDQLKAIVRPLQSAIDDREQSIKDNWISRFSQPVINVLPSAALILLAIVLTPLAIKVVFYFILAPLASRRPPICILPGAAGIVNIQSGNTNDRPGQISSVSQRITLAESEELLIHPEYLQSSPLNARIDTKWLLDWSLPFSSLASGMLALSRIRCADDLSPIVISSTRDPLSEVGILALPEGSAAVFQPRSLVGVVYSNDRPLQITRHWRLTSLHSWLTLQLRYMVFHGPSKLIVKGCRGARMEQATSGRRINQAATMGFSANLMYSTTRCETFVPYLMGEQSLFLDSFTGTPGVYVYEEMPRFGQKRGITGRGIEGVFDSLLKVFGI